MAPSAASSTSRARCSTPIADRPPEAGCPPGVRRRSALGLLDGLGRRLARQAVLELALLLGRRGRGGLADGREFRRRLLEIERRRRRRAHHDGDRRADHGGPQPAAALADGARAPRRMRSAGGSRAAPADARAVHGGARRSASPGGLPRRLGGGGLGPGVLGPVGSQAQSLQAQSLQAQSWRAQAAQARPGVSRLGGRGWLARRIRVTLRRRRSLARLFSRRGPARGRRRTRSRHGARRLRAPGARARCRSWHRRVGVPQLAQQRVRGALVAARRAARACSRRYWRRRAKSADSNRPWSLSGAEDARRGQASKGFCTRIVSSRSGTGGQQGDRRADQFLDPAHIFDRLGRQVRPGAGARRSSRSSPRSSRRPARPGLRPLAGRQIVDLLAVQP